MFEKRATWHVSCTIDQSTNTVVCKVVDKIDTDRFCNVRIFKDGRYLIEEATDLDMCTSFVVKYGKALREAIKTGGKAFSFEVSGNKIKQIAEVRE